MTYRCPSCDAVAIQYLGNQSFQYGPKGWNVTLTCIVPYIYCGKCEEGFTDYRAEKIREDLVNSSFKAKFIRLGLRIRHKLSRKSNEDQVRRGPDDQGTPPRALGAPDPAA
jgi:hypothetical protein